jgi:S1-C subfamily serine protease
MKRKTLALVAVFITISAASVQCLAADPRIPVARDHERYTISIALEFTKKYRSPLLRALASLGTTTPNGYASGFLVADGLVMTSYHVVSGQLSPAKKKRLGFKPDDELEVKAYVNGCPVKVVKVDEAADLALLRVSAPLKQVRRATFASVPANGDQLLLIAQPGQRKMIKKGSFRGTYSFGGYDYWAVRIEGQDGFSGSPVYDNKGNVVGVFCLYDWRQGVGLISPATQAEKLLTDYSAPAPGIANP